MKKLAVIGSGEMAVILVENAKRMGVSTYTFSNNSDDRVKGLSDEHYVIDIFDIMKIKDVCTTLEVDGVAATTELTIDIAARLASLLHLNGMSTDVSKRITDKGYVRKKVAGIESVRQPGFYIHEKGKRLPVIRKYPVIVKPTSMGGKRGITVAYDEKELEGAVEYAFECMPSSKTEIIIEEFIGSGKEYSVESLSYHGKHHVIQITEKISSGPPHCVELGHIQPADIPEEMHMKIERGINDILKAAGVDNTATHTEIKIVNDEIFLIELNARLGGDHIAYPLTELSTGYPYIQGTIDIALDQYVEPDLNKYEKKCCGVLFVVQQTSFLKDLFDKCHQYPWLYKKNEASNDLVEIVQNRSFDTNYMIYLTDKGIPNEISDLLK